LSFNPVYLKEIGNIKKLILIYICMSITDTKKSSAKKTDTISMKKLAY